MGADGFKTGGCKNDGLGKKQGGLMAAPPPKAVGQVDRWVDVGNVLNRSTRTQRIGARY
jgi:hypothetical protein